MKLANVTYDVEVNVSPATAWDVLARYGDVADVHPAIRESRSLGDPPNTPDIGSLRECRIPNGRKEIVVRKKIVKLEPGKSYVYEWENFPLAKMINEFGVRTGPNGKTRIFQNTDFRLKPGLLTWVMKGKLRSNQRDTLIAYKHVMETGESSVDPKTLSASYKDH